AGILNASGAKGGRDRMGKEGPKVRGLEPMLCFTNDNPCQQTRKLLRSRALSEKQMNHCATVQPRRKRAATLLVIAANVEDRDGISETLGPDAYEIAFCDSLALPDMDPLDEKPFDACMIELSRPVETSFDLLAAIKRKCPLAEVVILSRLAE